MTFKMRYLNVLFLREVIAPALRSGEYKQGFGVLHVAGNEDNPDKHCCMGVMCRCMADAGLLSHSAPGYVGGRHLYGSSEASHVLPREASEYIGLEPTGEFIIGNNDGEDIWFDHGPDEFEDNDTRFLASLNDDFHMSFPEIADRIEKLCDWYEAQPAETKVDPCERIDSGMITDTEARRIASEWHGGGGTALYAFSSTGAINTARTGHDLYLEIRDNYQASLKRSMTDDNETGFIELRQLLDYVSYLEPRGPVPGWSNLTW